MSDTVIQESKRIREPERAEPWQETGLSGNVLLKKRSKTVTEWNCAEERIRWLAVFPDMNPDIDIWMDLKWAITFARSSSQKTLTVRGNSENLSSFVREDHENVSLLHEMILKTRIFRKNTVDPACVPEHIASIRELLVMNFRSIFPSLMYKEKIQRLRGNDFVVKIRYREGV